MKSRRLTETDLANMAFKSAAVKRQRLIAIERPKKIIGSYEPFRQHCGDALNEQYPLLQEDRAPTPIELLEEVVGRACAGDPDRLAMNIPIARSTLRHATNNGISAHREEIRRIVFPHGHTYDFGLPMLMAYADGHIAAVFPDMRRSEPLNTVGQRFVWSAMHHRWRENYPDLSEVDLEIWRYSINDERTVRVIRFADQGLLSYDSIVADVRQTYAIWHEVLASAELDRRGAGRGAGPLFGQP